MRVLQKKVLVGREQKFRVVRRSGRNLGKYLCTLNPPRHHSSVQNKMGERRMVREWYVTVIDVQVSQMMACMSGGTMTDGMTRGVPVRPPLFKCHHTVTKLL